MAYNQLRNMGRMGDTQLAHVSPGEMVVPQSILQQNTDLRNKLLQSILKSGLNPNRYIVGGNNDSINPYSGLREFFHGEGIGSAPGDPTGPSGQGPGVGIGGVGGDPGGRGFDALGGFGEATPVGQQPDLGRGFDALGGFGQPTPPSQQPVGGFTGTTTTLDPEALGPPQTIPGPVQNMLSRQNVIDMVESLSQLPGMTQQMAINELTQQTTPELDRETIAGIIGAAPTTPEETTFDTIESMLSPQPEPTPQTTQELTGFPSVSPQQIETPAMAQRVQQMFAEPVPEMQQTPTDIFSGQLLGLNPPSLAPTPPSISPPSLGPPSLSPTLDQIMTQPAPPTSVDIGELGQLSTPEAALGRFGIGGGGLPGGGRFGTNERGDVNTLQQIPQPPLRQPQIGPTSSPGALTVPPNELGVQQPEIPFTPPQGLYGPYNPLLMSLLGLSTPTTRAF